METWTQKIVFLLSIVVVLAFTLVAVLVRPSSSWLDTPWGLGLALTTVAALVYLKFGTMWFINHRGEFFKMMAEIGEKILSRETKIVLGILLGAAGVVSIILPFLIHRPGGMILQGMGVIEIVGGYIFYADR